jgi:predicted RNA methylase
MAIVVALLLRAFFRVVDGLVLVARPALLRAWWIGWRALPSPYAVAADVDPDEDDLVYGEAFVVVARAVLRAHGVGDGSVVVDLGCGRGAVLVAARSLGAAARGVDICHAHVAAAGAALRAAGARVDVADARTTSLAGATHVWLAWATWSATTRAAVTERLRSLSPGAIVVSVVHAVDDDDAFAPVSVTRAPFSWGVADIVVQRRR